MKQTDPSGPRFAFGIEQFYLLVALASGAMLATGETPWVEQARVFLKIDLMLIGFAGVPRNKINAYRWLALAAKQGHEKAAAELKTLAAALSPIELNEARRQL